MVIIFNAVVALFSSFYNQKKFWKRMKIFILLVCEKWKPQFRTTELSIGVLKT